MSAADLVKQFEGCSLVAYLDQGGVWTIGYGRTQDVAEGQTCTQAEADAWLEADLEEAAGVVETSVLVPLTVAMEDAMISLVYNIGGGNFRSSTLLHVLNEGDYHAVPEQLCRWRFVDSVPSLGLVRRRVAEATRYLEDGLPPKETMAA